MPIDLPLRPATPDAAAPGFVGTPLVPCTQCAQCCTYVAVGINAPSRPRYATDILWYLYHERVAVHRDKGGQWSVTFETRCRHLETDLLCGIYETRPHICRSFDNKTCEVNAAAGRRTFRRPEEFLEYLKLRRPQVYRRVARSSLPADLIPRDSPRR